MTTVLETVPEELRSEVDAALAWWNDREAERFEVTGIVDSDAAPVGTDPGRQLRLVLCGGGRCERRDFRVAPADGGFRVELVNAPEDEPVPELDPPPGARRHWLDAALVKHKFVVLVFYRGFW